MNQFYHNFNFENINNTKIILIAFLFFVATFVSCKKTSTEKIAESDAATSVASKVPENFFTETEVPDNPSNSTFVSNATTPPSGGGFDPNNGAVGMVLGAQLVNPYTVQNMQNALNILSGTNSQTLVANFLYVRFKPSTLDDLKTLEENDSLELQDYPMDYEVVQDGDYYQDPTQGTEDIGWLYSVVPVGYTAPIGIQYEIITPLFLTENALLEDLAESLAGGGVYESRIVTSGKIEITRIDIKPNVSMTLERPCYIDPDTGIACGDGGGGGGVPPTPPLPPGIYVEEQRACGVATTVVPLRQARMVCKRWFKIWRGYTDDNGRFAVTKRFKNNVKIIVKTKNNHARIAKLRGARLWQMFFPCKKKLGVVHNSELATFRYVFTKPANGSAASKELMYWAATTTHNSVVEFRDYTAEFNLTQPPSNLKIIVSNWGELGRIGAAPMFNKCNNNVIPTVWTASFLASASIGGYITGGLIAVGNTLKNQVDIIVNFAGGDYSCGLNSSSLKSIAYHELGHAQHYAQAGCSFWGNYRAGIITELSKFNQAAFHPYGTGNDASTAPIIATGEMWGNHCEKIYADRYFGNGGAASNVFLSTIQGGFWANPINSFATGAVGVISGLNANLAAIESFDPNLVTDVHRWIPMGLPYDLLDARNDNETTVLNDNVTNYTINQCYNALQTDVQSIPAFRDRLLQQNGNNQQVQVNQLFQQYGY